jgi:diguanylate cyclase (GGDEF)-like protein/PAS domain S-box-containing protein
VHVLLVEHNPERARSLSEALRGPGHRVEVFGTGGAALGALARPALPDVLVVEDRLPDMTALDLLQAASRMSRSVPCMILGREERAADGVEAARLGALDFVVTDDSGVYLATFAARLVAARQRAALRDRAARLADALESTSAAVLIVDRGGRIEHANAAAERLLGRGHGEGARGDLGGVFEFEGEAGVKADLFSAMAVAGEWAGELQVVREGGERVPCIVTVSPVRRAGGRTDGLVLTLRDVSDRVAMEDALRAANRRLAEQASRDPLSGLYNRGYFGEVLEREMARALRYGDELAVLMVDQDEFKRVNDEHGHGMGDDVLIESARRLQKELRDGDVLARFGGDEFCVLLPNTSREAARAVAERLRRTVEDRGFGPDAKIRLHVSIGLAVSTDVTREKDAAGQLMGFADDALLRAKRAGGNRVIGHGD